MDKNTFNLIKRATTFLQIDDIYKYQDFIKIPINNALMIVSAVEASDEPLTLADIVIATGISKSIVVETVRALRAGGYPFVVTEAGTQGNRLLISKVFAASVQTQGG